LTFIALGCILYSRKGKKEDLKMEDNKTLVFDMDGTIADFYGVTGWLDYLKAEDTTPYEVGYLCLGFLPRLPYAHSDSAT
jgi:hypothetical protein